jgi:hypothetical protein
MDMTLAEMDIFWNEEAEKQENTKFRMKQKTVKLIFLF